MSSPRIPFLALRPLLDREDIDAAVARVLDRGWFVLGPELEAFEHEFAAAAGAAHAVGVGTGTDAIALILRALDLEPGDEVITTPLSAAYTALAILMAGARPVFADIDPDRLTLDPDAVEAAVTSRTRAILPVHLYGQPADLATLEQVAARHDLALVEDCCQAHAATCQGRPVGTVGIAGAFSFYPTKNLGALGDAGAITTDDPGLAARVRRLRNGGQAVRDQHLEPSVNSRLDEIQAAILRARLPRVPEWTSRRRALATLYRERLHHTGVTVPPEMDGGHVYHLFVVRTPDRAGLARHLFDHGIETLVHYPVPICRQPALAAARPADCPVTRSVCDEVLSLPLHPTLHEGAIEEIAQLVASFSPTRSGSGGQSVRTST